MRRCRWRREWRSLARTIGSIPITATARFVSRSASRRTRCCNRRWARRRTPRPAGARCRRTGGIATPPGQLVLAHRHAVSAGGGVRRSLALQGRQQRRGHAGLRRGRHQRRRILGGAELASLERLPVLFLIEDNGYAISVPVEMPDWPGGNISALRKVSRAVAAESGRHGFFASYRAMKAAVAYCREGAARRWSMRIARARIPIPLRRRAALQVSRRTCPRGRARPRHRFPKWLIEGLLDRHMLQRMAHEADQEVQAATELALHAEPPARGTALDFLYSDTVDPTSSGGSPRTGPNSVARP